MIKKEIKRLEGLISSLTQIMMHPPRSVRIKEYFPAENSVTVQVIINSDDGGGPIPVSKDGDQKFPLGYRGDVSEGLAPQPGDTGLLFYSGMQYKRGFVMLSHSEGGEESSSYVPIRGNWSLS